MKKMIILYSMILTASLLIILLAGCGESPTSTAPPTPVPAPVPAPSPPPPPGVIPPAPIGPSGEILTPGPNEAKSFYSVQSDFIPDGGIYFPGEQIDIEVKLTNESTGPVVIEQFPPKVDIYLPDRMDVDRTKVSTELGTVIRAFPAGTEERELGVNETVSFKLSWDQKDDNGNQVAPGRYYRQMELNLRTVEEPVNSWMSGGGGPAFLIQYPQGAMEKNIDLDISQTASGLPLEVDNEVIPVDITLTLKHVELTSEGVGFFVLLTSPDYPLPGDDVWWRLALHEHAEYSFDGTVKDARGANTRYTDEGIELRWGQEGSYRDPIPSDTRMLTFTITRLDDDWLGPWEFEIPLE